ncbi:leucine-rich repeat domain-containing protein [Candidatus Poribacteria bacterium]|nr:leucine-rich repeat domain-containing protein [Candidatus Poribacteria bacterium]
MLLIKKQDSYVYILILCATLFFLFPLITSAQTVNIPDVNLRAAIASALGKASNARITLREVEMLTHLTANNRGISDLTGLEAATGLEIVNLYHNQISDLSPLAGLIKLHTIQVGANLISDLSPVAGLISLARLNISENLVSDLSPVAGLTNLLSINFGNNSVFDLSPLAGLKKLEAIVVDRNPPTDLSPLSKLISLRAFRSWGTPILDLAPLAELPKLSVIDICGGGLSDLSPLANATGLKELYFVGNKITDVSPLAGLTNLTRLNFTENEISDVSPLAGLTNLTWIGISHNPVSDIAPLEGLSIPIVHHNTPAFPPGGPKIEGPWLWVLVPGDRVGGGDLLANATGGTATEEEVATVGAAEGKSVGDTVWAADNIASTGHNNIGEMLKRQRVGNDGVVYGSTTLESPREQETRMFVGALDGVEVWLNGELIHQKSDGDWAQSYHTFFPVTLNEGTNVLLVALDNNPRHVDQWRAFFGFDVDTEYTVNSPISRAPSEMPAYDVNRDGQISILDLILIGQDLGKAKPTNARADVNGDGSVNISDLVLVVRHLGEITGIPAAPSRYALHSIGLDTATVHTWIALAEIENDGSLVFKQAIANLQRLLALLIPERTALLANYPNPFNPETWIPYQLAEPANITIHIYAMSGALVRELNLGHQVAGVYSEKNRAAYWNGCNQLGEPVASGVYFYTFTAGDFTATRKMLIRK